MDELTRDLCRVCLDQASSFFTLMDMETKQRFETCTSVLVITDQDFPTKLCAKCHNQLVAWNAFRCQAIDTDRRLQRLLIASCSTKTEPDDSPTKDAETWENLADVLEGQSQSEESRVDTNGSVDGVSIVIEEENRNVIEGELESVNFNDFPPGESNAETARQEGKSLLKFVRRFERVYKCSNCPARYRYEGAFLRHQIHAHQKQNSSKLMTSEGKSGPSKVSNVLQQNKLQPIVKLNRNIHMAEQQREIPEEDDTDLNAFLSGESTSPTRKPKEKNSSPRPELDMSEERSFHCRFCDAAFKCRSDVAIHVRKAHSKKPQEDIPEEENSGRPFQCGQCEKAFTSAIYLKRHRIFVHSGIKRNECKICSKKFCSQNSLDEHVTVHDPCQRGEPRKCAICSLTFTDQRKLYRHEKIHLREIGATGKKNTCQTCNQSFTRLNSMRRHMLKMHPKDYDQMQEVRARTEKMIVQYRERQEARKRFSCEQCPKVFSFRGDLSEHTKWHSQERPFKCRYCNAAYKTQTFLNKHEREVHLEKSETSKGSSGGESPAVCEMRAEESIDSLGIMKTTLARHSNATSPNRRSQRMTR